jgi:ribosomal-protein-alanine N-acetyltransferase
MSSIQLSHVIRADAADLIAANRANQDYHLPWVTSFTDRAGFDSWLGRCLTGPNVGLVARERDSGRVVGVVNISEIVVGAFQSAYLGYYGMSSFSRKGLMALRAAVDYAFDDLGLNRLEANTRTGLLSLCDVFGCDLTFGFPQSKSRDLSSASSRQFTVATRFDTLWAEGRPPGTR